MYNPKHFQSENQIEVFEFMDQNPFATVINVLDEKAIISHLPLTPLKVGNQIELIGHIARANSHWKSLTKSQTTVVFHGPHTYITPTWYAEHDVPTWNYLTAHISGQVELIESYEGIVNCLKELTTHVERRWPSGWEFSIPDDLSPEILPKSIVGFKIRITEINFKKKLNQNRSAVDKAGVMKGREQRTDDNSKAILSAMRELL